MKAHTQQTDAPGFRLDAYLARIGHPGPVGADLETLCSVHRAHVMSIPFENLDPVRGIVPSLALDDLQKKLVEDRRGGYCYEQNLLLAAALRATGLTLRYLTGRVVLGTGDPATRPRTHMALLVDVPGRPAPYLADVGFGAIGALTRPIPLTPDAEHWADNRGHRLLRTGDDRAGRLETWTLQAHGPDGWASQYAFTTEPAEHSDITVANWYIATSPNSPFRSRIQVQRTSPDAHRSLSGEELTVTRADGTTVTRTLADDEIQQILVAEMGLPHSGVLHDPASGRAGST
ncbi:arylamine N-acetyltransferase [Kitasatospora sp. NPDC087314]|uniref:arylamine N-acetyltransferase family protein n=1 Tax=Kitasatospora sp. NPDC087314 TaxID=3364068 RepID=UPI0037F58058